MIRHLYTVPILIGSAIIGAPLLYSPLYQSIRLILFGALSLSSLTVSAAITDADQQKSGSLASDTASL